MLERPICHCPLCHTDRMLRAELANPANRHYQHIALGSLPHLATFDSGTALLSQLQSSKVDGATDVILCELLAVRALFPDGLPQTLLVLSFLPSLHATVRRAHRRYPVVSREDTAQQALSFLLEYLNSPQLRARQTYLAFAIARHVRRCTFEWAARESRSPSERVRSDQQEPVLLESAGDAFERVALLHHFLDRCLLDGTLQSSDLELIVQFKLEGGAENGAFSNAERQRLKRLVAKLRTRANGRRGPCC